MAQYLYIIRCNSDIHDGFYKVGVASDVESRLAQLQTGNPFELEIQACYEFNNAEIAERAIHQALTDNRVRGEWFSLTGFDYDRLRQLCTMLGGELYTLTENEVIATPDEIEEAEDVQRVINGYQPTIEDVHRLVDDPDYRLEYRHGENGVRGFVWRLRGGNQNGDKRCVLYIGKRSTIFEQVKAVLSEHHSS